MPTRFTVVEQHILHCVRQNPNQFSRSELAKLLVGSRSSRIADETDNQFYGRLADRSRKSVLAEIDSLIQQGFLALDEHRNVIGLGRT